MKQPEADATVPFPPSPPKPRKGLFVFLLVVFVLWMGLLVLDYVKTVWPVRH
jgi:hypothetical protein